MKLLAGKKTYITGIATVLIAIGLGLNGDLAMAETLQTTATGLLAVFLRQGIKTDAGK